MFLENVRGFKYRYKEDLSKNKKNQYNYELYKEVKPPYDVALIVN